MVLARIQRFGWLLILVLVTGLAAPMLASASPCDAAPNISKHTQNFPNGHERVGPAADRNAGNPPHCPECLTHAACAVSCLGLAILPATTTVMALSAATAWNPEASNVLPGVTPSGDIDPPRPRLHS